MPKSKSTLKRSLRTIGLLSLLVIFPLTSWYFLQTGLNFTKEKFDKLEQIASVDSFVFYPVYGDSVTNQSIKSRMSVIANPAEGSDILDSLKHIHADLIDEKWVWLLILNGNQLKETSEIEDYPFLKDSLAVKLIDTFAYHNDYYLFNKSVELKSYEIGLIDTKGELRYIYDIRDPDEFELFINHLVLLVPKE